LAESLAEDSRFPLAHHQRSDLAQVSQYLGVAQHSTRYPLDALEEQLRQKILTRHEDLLAPEDKDADFAQLAKKVATLRRQDPQDPYRLVATLPARVYIDASPDALLAQALIEAGKKPQVMSALWRRDRRPVPPDLDDPTVSRPLVYKILGRFKDPDSLVLTQDDYFDYLIGASRDSALIPPVVLHALTAQTLLFLGFQLADWSFRVLYRLILSQDGRAQGRNLRFPHAAVQVEPDGGQILDLAEARRYLTEAYGGDAIGLYWGSGEDFLRELAPRLPQRTPAQWDADDGGDDDD
ncbi:MAG: SIR2 family NAD-dependent protein deacylase, partial [Anaerolineae bacterium]